jgi:hypothetical protein
MHTLVVKMTVDPARSVEAARHLRDDVVAWAKVQPGFVSGQWLLSDDGAIGLGIVAFTSKEAAVTAAAGPRSYRRESKRAWNVDDVTICAHVASA